MPAPKRWVTLDVSHHFPKAPSNDAESAHQRTEAIAAFEEQMQQINADSLLGEMSVEQVIPQNGRQLLIAVRMPSDGYVKMSHQLADVPGVLSVSR